MLLSWTLSNIAFNNQVTSTCDRQPKLELFMVPVPRSFNLQLFSEEYEEGKAILHVNMGFN